MGGGEGEGLRNRRVPLKAHSYSRHSPPRLSRIRRWKGREGEEEGESARSFLLLASTFLIYSWRRTRRVSFERGEERERGEGEKGKRKEKEKEGAGGWLGFGLQPSEDAPF